MRVWRPLLGALVAALALFVLAVAMKAPRHDRNWVDHLAATPSATWNEAGTLATIGPVRDWQYLPLEEGVAILEVYQPDAQFDVSQLKTVWFIKEPHPGWPMMAHTFVVFDFGPRAEGGGGMVGLTIEARKVEGERYNPLLGALNRYELIYVWAEPRDLMTRRATLLGHDLYAYRLALTPAQRVAYFRALTERTQSITERPRFYNTLRSNCTNELAKAAGLSWDPAFILTGGAAEALFERGLIEGGDFERVREEAEFARRIKGRTWRVEAFNDALRDHGGGAGSE